MSKIGKKPIQLPDNIQVTTNHKVTIVGPLGELSFKIPEAIKIEKKDDSLHISRLNESRSAKAFHGLTRSLVANMVEGVTKGFKKTLELSGIGFRANLSGNKLVLQVGYSHHVEIEPPEGITFSVSGNKISIEGIDKELVGRIAANTRAVRPPDAYKGKGIRYEGEKIRLKPGKAAKVGSSTG